MAYTKYRHLAIEAAKPAPTDRQLAAIEALLGAALPSSFREFLKVANGGYVEYCIDVATRTDSTATEPLSFCAIFSAEGGTFCDGTFIGELRSGRQYTKIPIGVLPFARDGGGSIAYLDLSPEGSGRVVAFVEGLPEWTGLRTESAFIELAPSFDEYLNRLQINRESLLLDLEDAEELTHLEATEEWLDIGLPTWREDTEIRQAIDEARKRITGKRV